VWFAVAAAVVLVVQLPFTHATAWHYFEDAVDRFGLHLYAGHPEFQFGPLSVVVAAPLTVGGDLLAMVVMSAAGVWCALRLRELAGDDGWPTLAGGLLLVVVWGDIAVRTAHLDDALALTATMAGIVAAWRGRPWLAALAFGVAGAAKPWAIAFAPIVLAIPVPHRWRLLAVSAGVVVLSWAPFVLAEPHTLDTAEHAIVNEATSALRVLGVDEPETPDWVRPAQLLGGLAVTWLLVARGRWLSVVMAGVAVRLLLDPAANRYYTAGLVLGLLLHELVHHPRRLPWMAFAAAALLEIPQAEGFPPTLAGWLRLLVVAVVLVEAFRAPTSPPLPAGRRPRAGAVRTVAR
jgi:hypothetical protein